jgi:carbamoyl-phosphate synthase small subunit
MTGYQEIITDPSYKGQIVTMTYPLIGNYGINEEDMESSAPQVEGFAVRELSRIPSNWRSTGSLSDWLGEHGVPGIQGIDTRAITRRLRVQGAMKGILTTETLTVGDAVAKARGWHGMEGQDYVPVVTCAAAYDWDPEDRMSSGWDVGSSTPLPAVHSRIVAYDYGIKRNILRRLRQEGMSVRVVPATTSAADVLALKPDGVFLSNGPGDPAAVTYAIDAVRELLGKVPVFGICLGHQILSLALGGRTFKLKFGHRGANQPVKDLVTGRVEITAQNHGFAVAPDTLDGERVAVVRVNLNDGTVEGLEHREWPAFSVQYHPEASPGPHDASYLFGRFRDAVRGGDS